MRTIDNVVFTPDENRRITMVDIYRNGLSLQILSFVNSIIILFFEIIFFFTKYKLNKY